MVSSNLGSLILQGTHQGHRYIALGFNPFPYLGRSNLPMSVLTLNILGYLSGFGSEDAGHRTGEPWIVPAEVNEIITPAGKTIRVEPGIPFTQGTRQGIYQLIGPGSQKRDRAVNLADLDVSDLKIRLRLSSTSRPAAPATLRISPTSNLTPYIIAAILILAAGEALFTYRRRRAYLKH